MGPYKKSVVFLTELLFSASLKAMKALIPSSIFSQRRFSQKYSSLIFFRVFFSRIFFRVFFRGFSFEYSFADFLSNILLRVFFQIMIYRTIKISIDGGSFWHLFNLKWKAVFFADFSSHFFRRFSFQ